MRIQNADCYNLAALKKSYILFKKLEGKFVHSSILLSARPTAAESAAATLLLLSDNEKMNEGGRVENPLG